MNYFRSNLIVRVNLPQKGRRILNNLVKQLNNNIRGFSIEPLNHGKATTHLNRRGSFFSSIFNMLQFKANATLQKATGVGDWG